MALKLWADLVDDASVNTLPENGNFKSPGNSFIGKKNSFSYVQNILTIADGCAFDIFNGEDWRQISNRGDIDLNPLTALDQGAAFIPGTDYFVYLCLPVSGPPEIIVSANATYPAGFSASNSRKIGGFHYGHIRIVDETWTPINSTGVKYGSTGTIWQDNVTIGIIPNSVWDLRNRPKTLFGGLVKIGNIWVSIYQASAKTPVTFMSGTSLVSVSGGELQSKYGQLPATGTEGLCQYNFVELASRAGMRLMSYQEWLAAAIGNPQGESAADNYGWTKTTNTARARTGCGVNPSTGQYDQAAGIKPYAVSAYNVVDAVGNVWEWLSDYSPRFDASSGTWGWKDQLGAGMGQIYAWKDDGFTAFIAGGRWSNGVVAGCRAVALLNPPWNVDATIGSRLACDAA
jgi:hypothetical protein